MTWHDIDLKFQSIRQIDQREGTVSFAMIRRVLRELFAKTMGSPPDPPLQVRGLIPDNIIRAYSRYKSLEFFSWCRPSWIYDYDSICSKSKEYNSFCNKENVMMYHRTTEPSLICGRMLINLRSEQM